MKRFAYDSSEVDNEEEGEEPAEVFSDRSFEELLQDTMDYWRRWISGCTYESR